MAAARMSLQETLSLLATDPASAITEFEQLLLSNSGEDAFELAIRLLAAKLLDELESGSASESKFRNYETADHTFRAVEALHKKAIKRWPNLNGSIPDLGISPTQLSRCIRPLVGWRLVDSDLSWLDATLERLITRDAKGALGQYFTPRDIVRFCVRVLNPSPRDLVLDPACGSGGFLFEATRHSHQQYGAAPKCLGIDFGAKAIKVATLLSAASTRASIQISKANSIDGRDYAQDSPQEWKLFLTSECGARTRRAQGWGAWNRLGCTVLLTNPPFAGDIDEVDVLDAYETQQESISRKTVSREHLFLERSVHLLRPGGRLAIVLPQGLLANASASYIRSWLLRKCRVLGVVGLHQFAFLPYTSVKTAILFLEKPRHGEALPSDYQLFFAVSELPGKDSSGKSIGATDYQNIGDAFSKFLKQEGLNWAAASTRSNVDASVTELARLSEVLQSDRLDAEFYEPTARALVRHLAATADMRIGNLVSQKVERFKRQMFREFVYYDISSIDPKTGLGFPAAVQGTEAPSRASYLVQPGDVLVSTVRPERNLVGFVTETSVLPAVASNGFCVLRPDRVSPEMLFAYCKTDAFRKMLSRNATASMYPTVTDKDVLHIPFQGPPEPIRDKVVQLMKDGLSEIKRGNQKITEAITLMNHFMDSQRQSSSEARQVRQPLARYETTRHGKTRKRAKRASAA